MTLTVTRSESIADLFALEDEWLDLHSRSHAGGIFMTFPWVKYWWTHFCQQDTLQLLTARTADGMLVGIAPMVIRTTNARVGRSWRQCEFLPATYNHREDLHFIIEPSYEDAVVDAFMNALFSVREKWDVLQFIGLVADTPLYNYLQQSEYTWQIPHGEETLTPYVPLPESIDDWMYMVSKNRRKKQRRYIRQLDDEHTWNFSLVEDQAEFDRVFARLVTLHQQKWESEGLPGAFGEGKAAFFADVLPKLLAHDMLRMYYLQIDGEIGEVHIPAGSIIIRAFAHTKY
ncbi:MAG: GNAT family N-acetyltransferase [Chloroflexota bacterium]